ncbi:MAG: Crp/Fnr family transcriptional regulator, partial [bacterium]|nr:Crp/Fnr family transcriptional regulator [bacterium]
MISKAIDKNTETILSLVKNNYRLQHVDDQDIIQLLSYSHIKAYSKGSYVFMEGDEIDSMYIVVSGKIEINMNNHKFSEKIFSLIGPGQLLGLSEVFNCHGIHTTNALCEKDSTLAVISKDQFRSIIMTLPSLSFSICIIMGNMIGELRHEVSLSSAEVKIMTYLKNQMSNYAVMKDGILHIPRQITYDKLAKMLNIARETISRIFKNLKDRKIIEIDKEFYKILDKDKIDNIVPYYSCLS